MKAVCLHCGCVTRADPLPATSVERLVEIRARQRVIGFALAALGLGLLLFACHQLVLGGGVHP